MLYFRRLSTATSSLLHRFTHMKHNTPILKFLCEAHSPTWKWADNCTNPQLATNTGVWSRCRQCDNCLQFKRRQWTARSIEERAKWPRAWFITWTYENPKNHTSFQKSTGTRSQVRWYVIPQRTKRPQNGSANRERWSALIRTHHITLLKTHTETQTMTQGTAQERPQSRSLAYLLQRYPLSGLRRWRIYQLRYRLEAQETQDQGSQSDREGRPGTKTDRGKRKLEIAPDGKIVLKETERPKQQRITSSS